MNTHDIYFERHVCYDGKKLIKASELRRKVVQALKTNKNAFDSCLEYYEVLCKMAIPETKLSKDILFVWNGYNSSCWQFEKLHIMQLLSHWAHDTGINLDPKEAKPWFSKAIYYEMHSLKLLNAYLWIDQSIRGLPILQYRYHLANALVYASDYYYNMYTFKEVLIPIKKSYQMIEMASRLWKKIDNTQSDVRHALTLKHMAEELTDDECGERVALMTQALALHDVKELQDMYNLWKQQNDSVYYNVEETERTISCLSFQDSFQTLLSII
jgi:hypothetical protein